MATWVDTLSPEKVEAWIEEYGQKAMEVHHTDDPRFALWLAYVDRYVMRRVMVSYQDLEDWGYRDAYDAGLSPREAATDMLEDAGWSQYVEELEY